MASRLEYDRKHVKADEFKGKKVIDREGIEYGKVKHVHINSDTLEVVGITVHEGIHKDYFLSRDYVDRFTENQSYFLLLQYEQMYQLLILMVERLEK